MIGFLLSGLLLLAGCWDGVDRGPTSWESIAGMAAINVVFWGFIAWYALKNR